MGRIRVNQAATLPGTSLAGLLWALLVFGSGCSTPAVGAPCLPEQIPEGGFSDREAYIESSSVQCETRVCLVYQLAGDPRETCNPATVQSGTTCASKDQVAQRVYCTCRCDAQGTGFGECECPSGFCCEEVLNQGDRGVRGSYCVKTETASCGSN
jgi:hypothetical protein